MPRSRSNDGTTVHQLDLLRTRRHSSHTPVVQSCRSRSFPNHLAPAAHPDGRGLERRGQHEGVVHCVLRRLDVLRRLASAALEDGAIPHGHDRVCAWRNHLAGALTILEGLDEGGHERLPGVVGKCEGVAVFQELRGYIETFFPDVADVVALAGVVLPTIFRGVPLGLI